MKFSTIVSAMMVMMMTVQSAPIKKLEARKSMSGQATYYDVGLGSCGETNEDSELVAALSSSVMGGPNSSHCGKYVKVSSETSSVTVKVVDSCPGCGSGDIDLSPAAFKKLGKLEQGVIPVKWSL